MSQALVANVGIGSTTITVTDPVSGETLSLPITVASSGTVTSVTPIYNSSDVSGGALLFTGSSYTFSAKDQSGNDISSAGTWSSSDATNAPVNATTGVCAPASGITGATLTFTHTATGHTATVPVTVLKGGYTAVNSDSGGNYASDAAFRANISSGATTGVYVTPAPTGTPGVALYNDGRDEALVSWDNTRLFMGQATFCKSFPPSTDLTGFLYTAIGGNKRRMFVYRVERHALAGESGPYGPASTFTVYIPGAAGGAADKAGPGFELTGINGRAEVGYANGGVGGNVDTDWYIPMQSDSSVEVSTNTRTPPPEFVDGKFWLRIVLVECRGANVWSIRQWAAPIGTLPTLVAGVQAEMACSAAAAAVAYMNAAEPFGDVYNMVRRSTDVFYRTVARWEHVDGATYGDPFGVLGTQATPTLTSTSVSSIAHGATSVVVTLGGTGFTDDCTPIFSNAGIIVTPITATASKSAHITRTGSTQFQITIDCAAGATIGAGTVAIYNAATKTTSGTQPFSVT